jgi:hypothetical protein
VENDHLSLQEACCEDPDAAKSKRQTESNATEEREQENDIFQDSGIGYNRFSVAFGKRSMFSSRGVDPIDGIFGAFRIHKCYILGKWNTIRQISGNSVIKTKRPSHTRTRWQLLRLIGTWTLIKLGLNYSQNLSQAPES